MNSFRAIAVIVTGLAASACALKPPPPGLAITDGCYYLDGAPAFKIKGDHGQILLAGEVHEMAVASEERPGITSVIFTPGFHVTPDLPHRTIRVKEFPRTYLMMEPWTKVPTVMVLASGEPSVFKTPYFHVARGAPC